MKTTVEIPDELFRRAKATAAKEGISLKKLLTEAISDRLRRRERTKKRWEAGFGGLRELHDENQRIMKIIDEEFETVDEKEWR